MHTAILVRILTQWLQRPICSSVPMPTQWAAVPQPAVYGSVRLRRRQAAPHRDEALLALGLVVCCDGHFAAGCQLDGVAAFQEPCADLRALQASAA